ncbi:DUF3253 domain-containing protein [Streptomyces sp. NPDC059639]|uniref:DUF3253 domain-containing protein n=1 Tax=Streptomyces sp. NPDC059639 TaxID=3346891 RepID=UPI0036A17828
MTDASKPTQHRLEQAILSLLDQRAGRSICPSDAARAVYDGDDEGWRDLMDSARRAAARLAAAGEVEIAQRGHTVDPDDARGPVRIRRPQ